MTDPPSQPYPPAASQPTGSRTGPEGEPTFGPPLDANELGTLGPYRVVKELGHGGMGAVYLAFDTRLKRKVALKVMLPQFAAITSAKERFLREAHSAANLAHDHIVTVFEADVARGVPYIAMQFLKGVPLDAYLRKNGPPSWAQAVRIGYETALGLAAAHAEGVVHRDIKPANLWLEAPKGRVKILDFGLAKPREAEAAGDLTATGAIMGTPAYLAPEQARGEKVDPRADLFSLGVVLYQLCTGKQPFTGSNMLAILTALAVDEPVAVRDLNPAVPEALAQLIHQLMAKSPDQRPATARVVAEQLQKIRQGHAEEASLQTLTGETAPTVGNESLAFTNDETVAVPIDTSVWRKRRFAVWGGLAAVGLAIAVTTAILSQPRTPQPSAQANVPVEKAAPTLPPVPTGPDARGRMPIPPRDKIDAQRKVLHDPKAQKDWAALPAAKKREVAVDLLKRGPLTTNDAKAYAELELAGDFARETADAPTALAVCDELAKRFQVADPLALKVEALSKMAAAVPAKGEERRAYRNELMQLGITAAASDDYDLADRVAALAKTFASANVNDWYANQVGLLEDRVAELRTGRAWVQPFEQALQQNANDTDAQARVGEYVALVRHEWEKGAAQVKTSKAERPSQLAFQKEAVAHKKPLGPQASAAFEEAGDAWWAAADAADPPMQVPTRRRARFCYLRALGNLQINYGLPETSSVRQNDVAVRTKAARRLQPRIDAVPAKPVSLHIAIENTMRTHQIAFSGDEFHTSSQTNWAAAVRINHRSWGNNVPATANRGTDWLFPYDIDFTTVRQTGNAVQRWGVALWLLTPNGMEMHTYREPNGRGSFDLRLTFHADGFPGPDRFTRMWDVRYYHLPREKGDLTKDAAWGKLFAGKPDFTAPVPTVDFSSIEAGYTNLLHYFKAPDGVNWQDFGLVATTERELPAGEYELREFHDDSARFLIDDKLIVQSGKVEATSTRFRLAAGKHRVRVEFVQYTDEFMLYHWLRRVGP